MWQPQAFRSRQASKWIAIYVDVETKKRERERENSISILCNTCDINIGRHIVGKEDGKEAESEKRGRKR